MSITFLLPSHLATLTGGQKSIPVSAPARTVGEALQSLWEIHPALRDRVLDEQGRVRQHINIFVDNECIRFTGGLDAPSPEGSEILIVPAVSGG